VNDIRRSVADILSGVVRIESHAHDTTASEDDMRPIGRDTVALAPTGHTPGRDSQPPGRDSHTPGTTAPPPC
jgi:hypothetical protein